MAVAGWIWVLSTLQTQDLLMRTQYSEALSRGEATEAALGLLPPESIADEAAARLRDGPTAGDRDVTVAVDRPGAPLLLAVVELAGRTPATATADWVAEVAAALQEQGISAQVAVRPRD